VKRLIKGAGAGTRKPGKAVPVVRGGVVIPTKSVAIKQPKPIVKPPKTTPALRGTVMLPGKKQTSTRVIPKPKRGW
jgi:hypothetical protein